MKHTQTHTHTNNEVWGKILTLPLTQCFWSRVDRGRQMRRRKIYFFRAIAS